MSEEEEPNAVSGLDTSVGFSHVVGSSPGDGPVLRNALSPHALVACRAVINHGSFTRLVYSAATSRVKIHCVWW